MYLLMKHEYAKNIIIAEPLGHTSFEVIQVLRCDERTAIYFSFVKQGYVLRGKNHKYHTVFMHNDFNKVLEKGMLEIL